MISDISPINFIDVIKNEIEYPEATILFDLLLINGDENNRFIGLNFKVNEEFTPSAYFVADDVTDEIKEVSAKFFFENKILVEKSVLPNALKYMITNRNK